MKFCQIVDTKLQGILIEDTGIEIRNCKVDACKEEGIKISSEDFPKPVRILQKEVEEFLRRQPLRVLIEDSEVFSNKIGI